MLFPRLPTYMSPIVTSLLHSRDLFYPTVHSQNAAFGSAPTFDWLTKYRNRLGLSNPFAEDVFDPMKYMNLEDTNMTVSVSESDFEGL